MSFWVPFGVSLGRLGLTLVSPWDALGSLWISLELLELSSEALVGAWASMWTSLEPLGDHFGGLGGVLGGIFVNSSSVFAICCMSLNIFICFGV